jgi:hypothetical protein
VTVTINVPPVSGASSVALPRDIPHTALLRAEVKRLAFFVQPASNILGNVGAAERILVEGPHRRRRLPLHSRPAWGGPKKPAREPLDQPNGKNRPEKDFKDPGENFHSFWRASFSALGCFPGSPLKLAVNAVYSSGKSSVNENN